MRVFRACPFVTVGALLRINSRSPDVPNSLVAGKNAGNFADSAVFCENLSLETKTSAKSVSCRRIPYADEQGIISRRQGIFGREQREQREQGIGAKIELRQRHIRVGKENNQPRRSARVEALD
jgi:hypothetical protein